MLSAAPSRLTMLRSQLCNITISVTDVVVTPALNQGGPCAAGNIYKVQSCVTHSQFFFPSCVSPHHSVLNSHRQSLVYLLGFRQVVISFFEYACR